MAIAFTAMATLIVLWFSKDLRSEIHMQRHTEFSVTAATLAPFTSPATAQHAISTPPTRELGSAPIISQSALHGSAVDSLGRKIGPADRPLGLSMPPSGLAGGPPVIEPATAGITPSAGAGVTHAPAGGTAASTPPGGEPALVPAGRALAVEEHFIRVGADGNFMDGCRTFFPAGWNQYEVVEAAAGATRLYGASLPPNKVGPQLVRDIMDMAVADGLTLLRTFAFATNPLYPMQTAPGIYNEAILRGLDYVLDQARQRGIKVILALINNWETTGSAEEIVRWAGFKEHEQFFTEPACKQLYKDSAAAIIGRVNSINGRRYRDDPTIMAWNLVNEPRCFQCYGGELHAWFVEMAAYVKGLDPNHLLSLGEEGFYASTGPNVYANPATAVNTLDGWPGIEGQDFPTDLRIPHIDFGTMHTWVDNWFDVSEPFRKLWIQKHIQDAADAKMPILLEEFGKFPVDRDAFFRDTYDAVLESARSGGPLKGAAFWQWYDDGQVGTAEEGGGAGYFGIRHGDTTFELIRSNAAAMRNVSTVVPGCTAAPLQLEPISDCSSSWVGGKPGTGFEGPRCDIDINECVRGTAGCAAGAGCINTVGGFRCTCFAGHTGDGHAACTAGENLSVLLSQYGAAGPGKLACTEGRDIQYPEGAPGFEYDSTGTKGSELGNSGSVTAVQCQLACEMAPSCDAVSYNAASRACFLKAGPSQEDCDASETLCGKPGQVDSCSQWQTYRKTVMVEAAEAFADRRDAADLMAATAG